MTVIKKIVEATAEIVIDVDGIHCGEGSKVGDTCPSIDDEGHSFCHFFRFYLDKTEDGEWSDWKYRRCEDCLTAQEVKKNNA